MLVDQNKALYLLAAINSTLVDRRTDLNTGEVRSELLKALAYIEKHILGDTNLIGEKH